MSLLHVQLFLILKSSAGLERLRWVIDDDKPDRSTRVDPDSLPQEELQTMARLYNGIMQSYCHGGEGLQLKQRLRSLALPFADFSDAVFKSLIQTLQAIEELDFTGTSFNSRSWDSLKEIPRYRIGLKSLRIKNCNQVTGAMIHDILCTVSSLEEFEAGEVRASELDEKDRSWVCIGMKHLLLVLVLDANQQGDEDVRDVEMAWWARRLGSLTTLLSWDLGPSVSTAYNYYRNRGFLKRS
ncbi:hypothetical protein BGZ83_003740 [Gryganskiella cystojenkinii]|nr:hypothetical protein BGZ83_003740 [Gryganskiella cystojenkinii]